MATGSSPEFHGGESFFNKLSTAFRRLLGSFQSQIKAGKTAIEMPSIPIAPFQKSVMACCTGPLAGLCQLDPFKDVPDDKDKDEPIAGILHWQRPHPNADGQTITLYEHKPASTQHHGDPIADVFAVVARPNSCILAVADGCNWGIKPRLAARCAVHGVIDHLNTKLFDCPKAPCTTQDVFHNLLRALHTGQKLIIQHGGTTTTLCVAVVVELAEARGTGKWGLCTVSVGDSLCYVWREEEQAVYEVTLAMHLGQERNARDAGGCLGADLGDNPDLANLTCCFVTLAENDIVFLTSDGVSDNFDPVTLKEAVAELPDQLAPRTRDFSASMPTMSVTKTTNPVPDVCHTPLSETRPLPYLTPEQRQTVNLMKITNLLKAKWSEKRRLTAYEVRETIISYVIEVSDEKRQYLEKMWNELEGKDITVSQRRENDRKIAHHVKLLPGKLDHATIAAYKVGRLASVGSVGAQVRVHGHSPTHSYHMDTAVTTATSQVLGRHSSFSNTGGSIFYHPSPTPDRRHDDETILEGQKGRSRVV